MWLRARRAGSQGRRVAPPSRGPDDDVPRRLDALGLTGEPGRRDSIVDDLALERRHRAQGQRLARRLDLLRSLSPQPGEIGADAGTVPADVQHEPAALAGLA